MDYGENYSRSLDAEAKNLTVPRKHYKGYAGTLDKKIFRLIRNKVMREGGNCDIMDPPQMK